MARTEITEEDRIWLRKAVKDGVPRKVMATYLGVCEDTARRILQREDILHFDGAKFVAAPVIPMWTRPCIKCKTTLERPKNQYVCDTCREDHSTSDYSGVPDDWL